VRETSHYIVASKLYFCAKSRRGKCTKAVTSTGVSKP
jgi:hypothetical protein